MHPRIMQLSMDVTCIIWHMVHSWSSTMYFISFNHISCFAYIFIRPCVGSGVERIDPLCFMTGCHKRRIKQAVCPVS